eukprot:m.1076746 g.1076746  ORF g.1076746 m.1076746 type:complete len:174 (-) comp24248_c0_seq4:1211-1732(-)
MPNYLDGARLWATHTTVAPEDSTKAPELLPAGSSTRALVAHRGFDATLHHTVPDALKNTPSSLLSWIVVSVKQNASLMLQDTDLYPPLPSTASSGLFVRSFIASPCVDGADAIASGCVQFVPRGQPLFDISTLTAPHTAANPTRKQVSTASWRQAAQLHGFKYKHSMMNIGTV